MSRAAARRAFKRTQSMSNGNTTKRAKKTKEQSHLRLVENQVEAKLEYEQNKRRFHELKPRNENQALYISYMHESRLVYALGPAGSGKAQPLDSPIYTPNGWKLMGDMEVGTEVYTQSGEVTKVNGVFPQGKKDIFRITFQDGRQAECCSEHLWKVYNYDWITKGDSQWRVIDTTEMIRLIDQPSTEKRIYVPLPDHPVKSNKKFIIPPYLLGVILGDGCLKANRVSVSNTSSFIQNKIKEMLSDEIKLVQIKDKMNNQEFVFRVKDKEVHPHNSTSPFFKSLLDYGLMDKLSQHKFIPEDYIETSLEQKIELLNGLLDTDGYVCTKGSIEYCTVSEKLALQVQYLIRSIGGLCKIRESIPNYTYLDERREGQLAYILSIRIKDPERLLTLPNKRDRISENYQYNDSIRLRVEKIEYIGKNYAQCISVEHPSHLYITNDFIVTHNTFSATLHACQLLEREEIERIIVTRPMVGCDEDMGFLPGTEEEKYSGWVSPIVEILEGYFGKKQVDTYIKYNKIILKPLMMMRGSTFRNAVVILDEAQNTTPGQMKMFLTRVGEGTKLIINGDLEQSDLHRGQLNGLEDSVNKLRNSKHIRIVEFTEDDIVRDPLVRDIVKAYRTNK